jgi:hypothetical protein
MPKSVRSRHLFSHSPSWRARFPELSRIDADRARGGRSDRESVLIPATESNSLISTFFKNSPDALTPTSVPGVMTSAALLARAPLVRSRLKRVLQHDRMSAGRSPLSTVEVYPSEACATNEVSVPKPQEEYHCPLISTNLVSLTIEDRKRAYLGKILAANIEFDRLLSLLSFSSVPAKHVRLLQSTLNSTLKRKSWLPFWLNSSVRAQAKTNQWLIRISFILMGSLMLSSLFVVLSQSPAARWEWGVVCLGLLGVLAWDDRGRLTGLGFSERRAVYRHLSLSRIGIFSSYPAITLAIVSWCDNPRATRSSILRLNKTLSELLNAVAN